MSTMLIPAFEPPDLPDLLAALQALKPARVIASDDSLEGAFVEPSKGRHP
ncbi:hypothetical protein ACG04R_22465 [Roseateles sp. BYS78W]|uniref:Uncharacterized protein n=1 Tax=Pelomonas candidula TaxID=3299025 RepID=A0ABW7HI80_9BURK